MFREGLLGLGVFLLGGWVGVGLGVMKTEFASPAFCSKRVKMVLGQEEKGVALSIYAQDPERRWMVWKGGIASDGETIFRGLDFWTGEG